MSRNTEVLSMRPTAATTTAATAVTCGALRAPCRTLRVHRRGGGRIQVAVPPHQHRALGQPPAGAPEQRSDRNGTRLQSAGPISVRSLSRPRLRGTGFLRLRPAPFLRPFSLTEGEGDWSKVAGAPEGAGHHAWGAAPNLGAAGPPRSAQRTLAAHTPDGGTRRSADGPRPRAWLSPPVAQRMTHLSAGSARFLNDRGQRP
jgi:hypothetical protein